MCRDGHDDLLFNTILLAFQALPSGRQSDQCKGTIPRSNRRPHNTNALPAQGRDGPPDPFALYWSRVPAGGPAGPSLCCGMGSALPEYGLTGASPEPGLDGSQLQESLQVAASQQCVPTAEQSGYDSRSPHSASALAGIKT